ncbi:MAG: hypothetical protein ACOY3Y_19930 [Acidobacteriota bacterium]
MIEIVAEPVEAMPGVTELRGRFDRKTREILAICLGLSETQAAPALADVGRVIVAYHLAEYSLPTSGTVQQTRKALARFARCARELLEASDALDGARGLSLEDRDTLQLGSLLAAVKTAHADSEAIQARLNRPLPRRAPNYRVGMAVESLVQIFRRYCRPDGLSDSVSSRECEAEFVLKVLDVLPRKVSDHVLRRDYLKRITVGPDGLARWEPLRERVTRPASPGITKREDARTPHNETSPGITKRTNA